MIRITTNSLLRNYKANLMGSSNNLNAAREQVLTQRNFNSYAEDPAAATRAFQLRRSAWRVDAQGTNCQSVINKFESAGTIVGKIKNDLGNTANSDILRGLNGPTGAGREPLGQTLQGAAKSIVQSMNSKYGSTFIFAGADGKNVPFSWDEATGNLLFRGVNVNAGGVPMPDTGVTGDPNWAAYDKDQADLAKLKEMSAETTFVDLGMGMQEDANGNLIPASAFNSALSGIDVLGFGVDADGDPKNVVSIMNQLGDILSRCTKDAGADSDGSWATPQDQEDAERLQKKLDGALSALTTKHTQMDATSTDLNNTKARLKDTFGTLNEQILSIEQVDLTSAISSFSWAQYCYNAALKVGNSILSESLIDYMR